MAQTKMRGTSTAPIVLGIVGGVLDLPFALCSGACVAGIVSMEDSNYSSTVGNIWIAVGVIAGIIAIVFACMAKKNPKLAGIMLIISTVMSALCFFPTLNIMGFIATILTLIGAILCFTQKKEPINPDN